MTNAINGLGIPQPPTMPPQMTTAADPAVHEQPLFERLLLQKLNEAQSAQEAANAAIEKGVAEGDVAQVEIMASMKKADMALRTMLQLRNKIMEAYQEIQQLRM
jgi:flagellar hook-basal body complex protein FliE